MIQKIISLLLGVLWGVLLTVLSIGIWQHFDNSNWGALLFGIFILIPTAVWLFSLDD